MVYLFLNSISTGEIIIIMIFILMFFGSKNIPGMAKTFGKGLRQIRDATDDIKRDIRQSVDDITDDVKSNMKVDKDIEKNVTSFTKDVKEMINQPKDYVKKNMRVFEGDYTPEKKEEVASKETSSKTKSSGSFSEAVRNKGKKVEVEKKVEPEDKVIPEKKAEVQKKDEMNSEQKTTEE